jgi:hypothetical protein
MNQSNSLTRAAMRLSLSPTQERTYMLPLWGEKQFEGCVTVVT